MLKSEGGNTVSNCGSCTIGDDTVNNPGKSARGCRIKIMLRHLILICNFTFIFDLKRFTFH